MNCRVLIQGGFFKELWRRDSPARLCTSTRSFVNTQIGSSISARSFGNPKIEKKKEEQVEANFGSHKYWDGEYSRFEVATWKKNFDWYQNYNKCIPMRQTIRDSIPKTSKVLNIGCGNSLMSEQMVEDGYSDITNIDFSEIAIRIMNKRTKLEPKWNKLIYLHMDAAKLDFPNESFDAIIDKGTIDAQLCAKLTAKENITAMVDEAFRVLKPGGVFFVVSFYKDLGIMFFTKKGYAWSITPRLLSDFPHYSYVIRKQIIKPVEVKVESNDEYDEYDEHAEK